jgi:nucleoid-associated protein YgaU
MSILEEEKEMRGFRVVNVRTALMLAAIALVATGCCKVTPQEVTDVNRALGEARDECASVYAADDLQTVEGKADDMNALADDKKCKKARKAAEPLAGDVDKLKSDTAAAKDAAKKDAEGSMAKAKAALEDARQADAPKLVANAYKQAEAKADEAKTLMNDPCKYREAKAAADEAARLAANAKAAAIAEAKRLEEERRKAEEARRRAEEEARRRAEEEQLRRFPPNYTVERGDCLWNISGMEKIYNDSTYWPIVYDANGDQISDPDLIYPGQQFSIPRGMSDAEMDTKLHEMWRKLASGAEEE